MMISVSLCDGRMPEGWTVEPHDRAEEGDEVVADFGRKVVTNNSAIARAIATHEGTVGAGPGSGWGWGTSPDQIDGREDDREAAIAAAREQAKDGATVYVWSHMRDIDPGEFVPDAEDFLGQMGDLAYHNRPESIQDDPWPDATTEQAAELDRLLEPIRAWARRVCSSWWVAEGEPEAVPPEPAPPVAP